jgi:hypothetical protein
MTVDDEGQVTLSVDEMNDHLRVRGEAARDVGVALTAGIILVANAFSWSWVPWVLLIVALGRVFYGWGPTVKASGAPEWARLRRQRGGIHAPHQSSEPYAPPQPGRAVRGHAYTRRLSAAAWARAIRSC